MTDVKSNEKDVRQANADREAALRHASEMETRLHANVFPSAAGISKRELFAAMAMQGWLAGCRNAYSEFTAPGTNTHVAAESAVKFADALLSALLVSEKNT